ncbi:hypothetical protein OUZ56_027094 [Daphnia magna]|uniref:Uncharacterized protein n=1 Tax=Daphnia magna TaxID=35525 RepID=A0ABQ9ZNR5_9CRUS|nr:hypothetical protein OUZ56_027094 [Daphnia magna]
MKTFNRWEGLQNGWKEATAAPPLGCFYPLEQQSFHLGHIRLSGKDNLEALRLRRIPIANRFSIAYVGPLQNEIDKLFWKGRG